MIILVHGKLLKKTTVYRDAILTDDNRFDLILLFDRADINAV